MPEPTHPPFGQHWDISASIGTSNASTVLSDDDLDSLALASELEDGMWDDSDGDNDSVLPHPLERSVDDYRQSIARAGANEHDPEPSSSSRISDGAAPDLTLSDVAASEDTGSTSTFSFHFPDPLRAQPDEHPRYNVPHDSIDSLISRDSMRDFGTEFAATVDALERSATLKPPPSDPPLATHSPRRTWVAIFIAVLALLCVAALNLQSSSILVRDHGVSESSLPQDSAPYMPPAPPVDTLQDADEPATPVTLDTSPRTHFPITALPMETRVVLHTNRTVIMSLSLRPISRVMGTLTHTYSTFSKAFLNDLRNVVRIIEELLLYLRETIVVGTTQRQSKTVLEYLAEKMGDRHQRAKHNAKALTAKGVDFVKAASKGISDAVKAMST